MKIKRSVVLCFILFLVCCSYAQNNNTTASLVVLGTAQDAGYPQINCQKECCMIARKNPGPKVNVSCLGLILDNEYYLFDATPDIKDQIEIVHENFPSLRGQLPKGIFLTHAHIGHYTGLMELGREATNANNIKVYAMPGMASFLEENGPWNQLVKLNNINIIKINRQDPISITGQISVTPFLVPHRDEFSETVGYEIRTNDKRVIFIPDIDKWDKWEVSIADIIKEVDYAFLDATFYDINELPNRNMSDIPHPFVVESVQLLNSLNKTDKGKVHFIHFNHSNPLLNDQSMQSRNLKAEGFSIARQGLILVL